MYKHLSLIVLLFALFIIPSCRVCKKKDICAPCKPRREKIKKREKKVNVEMASLADLYDNITEEELILAEAEMDNDLNLMELVEEPEAPRKM